MTPSERALFTKRRKEAYEALHPETRNGAKNEREGLRQVGEVKADRFTAATAAATGHSELTVLERAEHVDEWVRLTESKLKTTFSCSHCSEIFDAQVWHCLECHHHWPLAKDKCTNCHRGVKPNDAAQVGPHRKAGQQPGGINAASRELGIERKEAQRSVKVASISQEAKQEAVARGLDDNQTVLLAAAAQPGPERQLSSFNHPI